MQPSASRLTISPVPPRRVYCTARSSSSSAARYSSRLVSFPQRGQTLAERDDHGPALDQVVHDLAEVLDGRILHMLLEGGGVAVGLVPVDDVLLALDLPRIVAEGAGLGFMGDPGAPAQHLQELVALAGLDDESGQSSIHPSSIPSRDTGKAFPRTETRPYPPMGH